MISGRVGRDAHEEQVVVDLERVGLHFAGERLEFAAFDCVAAEHGNDGSSRDVDPRKDASTFGASGTSNGERREPRLIQDRRQ